jgi:hypothetical protein
MHKIGAFISTHNSPLFLRFCFLQILQQTVLPHHIVIFENNHSPSYAWVLDDLMPLATERNITVQFIHTELGSVSCDWYSVPLKQLLADGCDYFFPFDHDDIYAREHIATMLEKLEQGADFVINRKAGIICLHRKKNYDFRPAYDFTDLHAPKGMSGSAAFSRAFAIENAADYERCRNDGLWNDQVLARETMPKFSATTCFIDADRPTTQYVVHGANMSSAHWVDPA